MVKLTRILGVYPHRQQGLFMQRVKIYGGRLTWRQWRRIAESAAECSPERSLHVTTRQDVELHGLRTDDVPAVQQALAEVGLTTFGAGGDAVRNITTCSCCEFNPDGWDLWPLAQMVRLYLEQQPVALDLPRKFKISFSGCARACAKPFLSDLGFVAQADGLLTVIGAGSLGPRPALGIEIRRALPAAEVLPLSIAALELFAAHGDRQDRQHARLRHVRQKMGDEQFKAELEARFERKRSSRCWPSLVFAKGNSAIRLLHRLQLPNGNIGAAQAVGLADVAEPAGAVLRINLEHGLELYGTDPIQLPAELEAYTKNPIIVACPGSRHCQRGLVDCWSMADEIRRELHGQVPPGLRVCISGCPNNCAQSAVADIGLVGAMRKNDGKVEENYRLFTGGGNGQTDELAKPSCTVAAKQVCEAIRELVRCDCAAG